jgi:uncharacterized protein GlcG (DUF336 family)
VEQAELVEKLLEAAEMHVPFDGWGDETFAAACRDADIDESFARLFLPQGGLLVYSGEGSIVAGIGVSGAPSPELDDICAQNGIDAIEDEIAF